MSKRNLEDVMRRRLISVSAGLLILFLLGVSTALADGSYTVQRGDTLASIARAYGVSVRDLAAVNGLSRNDWVYIGQRLAIPGQSAAATRSWGGQTYTVQAGDTLNIIAARFGVSVASIQRTNGLPNADHIYSGQALVIPGGGQAIARSSGGGERWIDVNLSNQLLTAYEGQTPVMQTYVSTGEWDTPTVVGTFRIYVKHDSARMYGNIGGEYYDLPNVPHVMYFYGGYGLHGTYWHSNFGTPMSHGCVNLSQGDAAWLYNWASVGTKVVTHY